MKYDLYARLFKASSPLSEMNKDSVQERLQQLELDMEVSLDARTDVLRELISQLDPSDKLHQTLLCEWAAWMLHPRDNAQGQIRRGQWFAPTATAVDKHGVEHQFPDPALFSQECLSHLSDRARTTANPEVAARFADIVWEKRAGGGEFAGIALRNYAAIAKHRAASGNATDSHLAATYTKRAIILALQLGASELIKSAAELYREILEKATQHLGFGWLQQMIREGLSLLKRGLVSRDELIRAAHRLYEIADEGFTRREAREVIAEVYAATGAHDEAKSWRIKGAEELEAHADFFSQNDSPLVAASIYQQAARAYADLGATDQLEKVKIKMLAAAKKAPDAMKALSVSVPVPKEEIEEFVNWLKQFPKERAIQALIYNRSWIIDLDHARKIVEEIRKKSVVASLATRVVFDDAGQFHEVTDEESERYEILEYLLRGLQIATQLTLGAAFETLRNHHRISSDDVISILKEIGTIESGRLEIIKSGVDGYLREDHVAALHVLIPQVEGILRDLAAQIGVATVSLKEAGTRVVARPLDEILAEKKLREGLGEDFATMIEAVLTDPLGWRTRHRLSHGNITIVAEFSRQKTEIVLYILLQLSKYAAVPVPPVAGAPGGAPENKKADGQGEEGP